MRVRTVLALATGGAIGAGWMYLLDPAHGQLRRRDARRRATRRMRRGTVRAAFDARRRAEEIAIAAAVGYRQARSGRAPAGDAGLPGDLDGAVTGPRPAAVDRRA